MPKLIIDGKEIEVEDGLTVMQACELSGVEIPRFCYHERLAIAGNCRMCLVEVEKSPKPVASCAMSVSEGMVVHTNSEKVKKAREGVMEFLLINHPLDCPICDEAGECDLQDQAFKYGRPSSKFHENKRSVEDKDIGPLIQTKMTRCIHCTRCVRFSTDVAGIEEMGAIGRGEHVEITTYLEQGLKSELSGNMIDLCPVGALTSKPYAFKARSWELKKTDSIDVMDAVGSNIRVDSRGLEVMRILPRLNEGINEEWISDKIRFSYDGLKLQRLDRPYLRKNGKLVEVTFAEAYEAIAAKMEKLDSSKIGAIAGTLCDLESLYAVKKIMQTVGSLNMDANQFNYEFDLSFRANYLFNTQINNIDKVDLCLLVGANPRAVAPILNARIGKAVRSGKMKVARIGVSDDQTYKIKELGEDASVLLEVMEGKHEFCELLSKAKNPMIIIGDSAYLREDSLVIQSIAYQVLKKYKATCDDWNGFNILHNHASMVGSLDIGFTPGKKGYSAKQMLELASKKEFGLLYLLGADDIDLSGCSDCFIVYQGHHGDRSAVYADVILPGAAFTEKDGLYINLEGRLQKAYRAVPPPGQAKEDWQIIFDLATVMGKDLGFRDLSTLREQLMKELPPSGSEVYFASNNKIIKSNLAKVPINFYMTDQISRASVTMAKCTQARNNGGL
jgi:NADH-quinone oxidoreductase subunit G